MFNKVCKKCGKEFQSNSRNKRDCQDCSLRDEQGNWKKKERTYINRCNFFENDLEGYSYFMGFGYADGYCNPINTKIYVMSTDLEIIEKIKNRIGFTGTVCSYKNKKGYKTTHQINLCGKTAKYFIDRGFINDKDLLSIPANVEFYHFLRGFFDGDGFITLRYNKNGTVKPTIGFSGRIKLLTEIQSRVGGTLRRDRNIWFLNFNTSESIELLNKMYYNASIYLQRKYC